MEIRTALITGASSGIGAAYARQLAASGCRLILVARRTDRMKELAAEIAATSSIPIENLEILPTDLGDSQSLESLRQMISGRDDIDLLINNAGFGMHSLFLESPLEAHLNMLRVHVVASMALIHTVLPGMIARRRGYIINVSSIAAFMPSPGHTSYSSTKACLNMFFTSSTGRSKTIRCHNPGTLSGFNPIGIHQVMGTPQDNRPSWAWMTADQVVKESLNGLKKNKVIVVPGFLNQIMVALLHVPFLVQIILNRVEASLEKTGDAGQAA